MRLWLLTVTDDFNSRGYYNDRGMVVRAETEADARRLADGRCDSTYGPQPIGFWTDPAKAKCEPLTAHGPAEIVMIDGWFE